MLTTSLTRLVVTEVTLKGRFSINLLYDRLKVLSKTSDLSLPSLCRVILMLTQDQVRSMFWYDPGSGLFIRRRTGRVSSTNCGDGYKAVGINGKMYKAHRLAWLYMTGVWPTGHIDHIDRDRANNAWYNLRDVSIQENNKNRGYKRRQGGTGIRGVVVDRSRGKLRYRASICVDGRTITLGRFATPEAARQCYLIHRDFFV